MNGDFIWAAFQPFGKNMWSDVPVPRWGKNDGSTPEKRKALLDTCAADHLRFDEDVWRRVVDAYAKAGANMIVMDVGEALAYPSHPELWVKGSWSPDRVRDEVRRCRALGIELIPKLNFSTGHDTWLKDYHRMVSTKEYYQVCADVIRDAWEAYDHPRYIHLGYDEEDAGNQCYYGFVCVRQGELWWHDFLYISGLVEKLGARPWIWSDFIWHHEEDFLKRMPKSVLQSNWYYGSKFDVSQMTSKYSIRAVKAYEALERGGFDQVPCGSVYSSETNFPDTVRHCRRIVAPERLKGFLIAPWTGSTQAKNEQRHLHAAEVFETARKVWDNEKI